MTFLIHLVYAAVYVVIGITVGAVLPYIWPSVELLTSGLVGVMIVLAGALVHEIVARNEALFRANQRIRRLEEGLAELNVDMFRARGELDVITGRLDEARRTGGMVDYDTVMNEVKLLQNLVGRLHEKRSAKPAEARPASQRRVPESGGAVVAAPQTQTLPATQPRRSDASVLETVRDALRADRIDIYLQPIVSLPQRKHRFYEVFSRVRAADGTQIMPERYLELAEREGLIATIDNLLLVRCIQLIRETERRQHSIGFFSNISAATINDGEFMRQFLQFMGQNQTLVPKLVFELSQDDWINGDAGTLNLLSQLAKMGFHFSMDQVTSLDIDVDALSRAEIRYLKIDRVLLLDPNMRPRALALRRSLEGRSLDLIVEKIETENQLIELLDLGIDFGQGYLFGEPRMSRKPA